MKEVIIGLLVANAIAHVVSFKKLKDANDNSANGVAAFVVINLALAVILGLGFAWAKWPVLLFPLIGGLGLLLTTIIKGKGTWIDYVILILDIAIVGLVLNHYIL